MADVYDILTSDDGELAFEGGDLKVGESTLQHQEDLMLAGKGSYKQYPTIGVSAIDFLQENELEGDGLAARIQEQLQKDGMTVEDIVIESLGNIQVSAYYE